MQPMRHAFETGLSIPRICAIVGVLAGVGGALWALGGMSAEMVSLGAVALFPASLVAYKVLGLLLPPSNRVVLDRRGFQDERTMPIPVPWPEITAPARISGTGKAGRTLRLGVRGPGRYVRRHGDADATGFDVPFDVAGAADPARRVRILTNYFRRVDRYCRKHGIDFQTANMATLDALFDAATSRYRMAWRAVRQPAGMRFALFVAAARKTDDGAGTARGRARWVRPVAILGAFAALFAFSVWLIMLFERHAVATCGDIKFHTVQGTVETTYEYSVPPSGRWRGIREPTWRWSLAIRGEHVRFEISEEHPAYDKLRQFGIWPGSEVEVTVREWDYRYAARNYREGVERGTPPDSSYFITAPSAEIWGLRRYGDPWIDLDAYCNTRSFHPFWRSVLAVILACLFTFWAVRVAQWIQRRGS